jgi:hypothetical protein
MKVSPNCDGTVTIPLGKIRSLSVGQTSQDVSLGSDGVSRCAALSMWEGPRRFGALRLVCLSDGALRRFAGCDRAHSSISDVPLQRCRSMVGDVALVACAGGMYCVAVHEFTCTNARVSRDGVVPNAFALMAF